jgi:hypothetical protein
MSTSLTWRPAQSRSNRYLTPEVKFFLRKQFMDDGPVHNLEFGDDSLTFLRGAIAGGATYLEPLVKLIEKHGSIILDEES